MGTEAMGRATGWDGYGVYGDGREWGSKFVPVQTFSFALDYAGELAELFQTP